MNIYVYSFNVLRVYLRNNNDLLPLLSRAALCRGDGEIFDEDNLDKQENRRTR